jgi:hypothetical protein
MLVSKFAFECNLYGYNADKMAASERSRAASQSSGGADRKEMFGFLAKVGDNRAAAATGEDDELERAPQQQRRTSEERAAARARARSLWRGCTR